MDAHEKLIVTSLSKHATEAPSDEDLLAAVHHRLQRRRSGRTIGAAVLACAVVATAITATHSITSELRTDSAVAHPDADWRWESYKTVQVQVPANWSQYISGPAPCTFSTSWTPAIGRFNGWFDGRRVPCVAAVLPVDERREYLWFDDVQAPGITTYDGGWTEETRLVGGVKLSVLTTDDALRERILDSARPITSTDHYGCAPADATVPRSARPSSPALRLAPNERIESAGICEYWRGSLVAGSQLPTGPATELARRLANSPVGEARWPEGCEDQAPRNFEVTLHGRSTSWSVRVSYSTCYTGTTFPADDGTTRRLADASTLDLIRQGVHKPSQPSDLIDPPATATPSPR